VKARSSSRRRCFLQRAPGPCLPTCRRCQAISPADEAFLNRLRDVLQRATGAESLPDEELERLALQIESLYLGTRLTAVDAGAQVPSAGQEKIVFALRQCLRDCESQYSRCIGSTDLRDRAGRAICNLQALGCVADCGAGSGLGGFFRFLKDAVQVNFPAQQ